MDTPKKTAAIAGILYLALIVTGIFHLMYVPSKLIDWHNATVTLNQIRSSEMLFRLGVIAGIISYLMFLFLPLVLYHLLSPISRNYAFVMVALAVVSVPISLANMLHKFAVLSLISKASYLSEWDLTQLQTEVMLQLRYYSNGNQLASIFWGLWLFPLGLLFFRSGYLPKVLGVLLMLGCFGY